MTHAGLTECIVVGHSMSGKIAAVLAAQHTPYLSGLVLVMASPPSPEPMSEDARRKLMDFDRSRRASENYIDAITATSLPDLEREIVVTHAMRALRSAWRRWVTDGSQEDCAALVGRLTKPALVNAGEHDESLGPSNQRDLVMPHFENAHFA